MGARGSTIPFDTRAYVKQLTAVGVPDAQAEVHARVMAELVNDQLATKSNLEALRLELQRDMAELEIGLQRELKDLELRLTLRLGVLIAAAVAIVAALVKLL